MDGPSLLTPIPVHHAPSLNRCLNCTVVEVEQAIAHPSFFRNNGPCDKEHRDYSVSFSVSRLLGWPVSPSVSAIVAALAVSGGIGIIFRYYPAWKASRLDPIEALRCE
jgi:ABC-type lipoprotein release transport system permease subunit